MILDQHTIRITGEQAGANDNDNDNNGNRESGITITTSLVEPQSDPNNDPKYDSIDWQDDDTSKNLSIEEMDEILEEDDSGAIKNSFSALFDNNYQFLMFYFINFIAYSICMKRRSEIIN